MKKISGGKATCMSLPQCAYCTAGAPCGPLQQGRCSTVEIQCAIGFGGGTTCGYGTVCMQGDF
jgi:hypothetical protein